MKNFVLHCLLNSSLFLPLSAQVDYEINEPLNNRWPWNTSMFGSDQDINGWFYNLGITGIRIILDESTPKELIVKHIDSGSPASGRIQINDRIQGTNGANFINAHQRGYGINVFGARGPIEEFASALETAQSPTGNGNLSLKVRRGTSTLNIDIPIGKTYGSFSSTFPQNCTKCSRILQDLAPIIRSYQKPDGRFGNGDASGDLLASLALLGIGGPTNLAAVERCARHVAQGTNANSWLEAGNLVNWDLFAAAMILSEYYLATGEQWVKPELQEIYQSLLKTQYNDRSQIVPGDPDDPPPVGNRSFGGWGHNPGFEGYGPFAFNTGQGALSFALMQRCGINIDRAKHDASYNFLIRATGPNHYVWYSDPGENNPNAWADCGRTGIAALANFMANYQETAYRTRALQHAQFSGNHPQSFPDTHAAPEIGMVFQALGTFTDPASFRKLMDANKWWFALAQTHQKSFFYQPNRDNQAPDTDFRLNATCATAIIFSIHNKNYYMSGKRISGYDQWAQTFPQHLTLLDPWGDFDGDNKTNLAEFQDGTNPISNAGIIAVNTTNLENKTFTYTRQNSPNTTFSIWHSTDLATWTQDRNAIQTVTGTNPDGTQNISVTLSITPPNNSQFFIRVKTP